MPGARAVASFAGPVATGTLATVGQTPALAMGLCDMAMAGSLGLAMGNAVANQQRGQLIAQAALTQVLTLIITKGASS